MKKLVMEFLGTFFLVLTVAVTGNPLAIASVLMAWTYIGGFVSGAHYNPAVSLAVGIRSGHEWIHIAYYTLAQVLGGIIAYATTYYLHGSIHIPAPAVGLVQAFIVEILLAFVFTLVVLTVSTAEVFKNNYVFGFAIGFTIPALVYLGTPISGGLFNPAIALGANLLGVIRGMPVMWSEVGMYVGGALIGGALAAYAFDYFRLDSKRP
ncbi:aquaporin [Candidatus Dependentiae bacterium]|nr:aquaporin [Candidatus Dependentiae bacterium]